MDFHFEATFFNGSGELWGAKTKDPNKEDATGITEQTFKERVRFKWAFLKQD